MSTCAGPNYSFKGNADVSDFQTNIQAVRPSASHTQFFFLLLAIPYFFGKTGLHSQILLALCDYLCAEQWR